MPLSPVRPRESASRAFEPFSGVTAGFSTSGLGGQAPGAHARRPSPSSPAAWPNTAAPDMTPILGHDRLRGARHTWAGLANLSTDPRLFWWGRRVIMSVAGGAIVSIWLGWRLAVTAAALVGIADALYRFRTTAAIPATARATSAQRRTKRRLARLVPAGYLSLHTRLIPGGPSIVHHLVVGPAGVYAVDSERWDRRLPVRATQGDQLYHGPYDQAHLLRHAQWTAAEAGRLISELLGQTVTVRPAIAIYGPVVPWIVAQIAGVDVFRGRRLRRYLRREAAANRSGRLDDRQIELIHAVAAQALPPAR